MRRIFELRPNNVPPHSFPHIQLTNRSVNRGNRNGRRINNTMPRLHSNVALRSDRHSSGRSSAWCFRQSDGRFPCFITQSDCMRQSLSAAIRFWHEEAMGGGERIWETDWRMGGCARVDASGLWMIQVSRIYSTFTCNTSSNTLCRLQYCGQYLGAPLH